MAHYSSINLGAQLILGHDHELASETYHDVNLRDEVDLKWDKDVEVKVFKLNCSHIADSNAANEGSFTLKTH